MSPINRILDYLGGWRKHTNCYVQEAIYRRGLEGVETYLNGLLLKLTYRNREIVFHAVPCNQWGDPADVPISYIDYIQEKVDEVSGIRWSFKYDGTD